MKRLFAAAIAALALIGCNSIHQLYNPKNNYSKRMFYERYLNPANPLDSHWMDDRRGRPAAHLS